MRVVNYRGFLLDWHPNYDRYYNVRVFDSFCIGSFRCSI